MGFVARLVVTYGSNTRVRSSSCMAAAYAIRYGLTIMTKVEVVHSEYPWRYLAHGECVMGVW